MKAAAEAAAKALVGMANAHAVPTILTYLFECMDTKKHPATKEAALNLVKDLVSMHPKQITRALPDIVPNVSGCMNDSKQSVKVGSFGYWIDGVCKLYGRMSSVGHGRGSAQSCLLHLGSISCCLGCCGRRS